MSNLFNNRFNKRRMREIFDNGYWDELLVIVLIVAIVYETKGVIW